MMKQNEKLSFADFNRKLRKYCTNGVACSIQEKEIVARLEALITQRDVCLAQLAKEKEKEMLLCEEIEDLQHQQEEAVELLATIEKRCNKLATEKPPVDTEAPSTNVATMDKIGHSERLFQRILRKYCNLYVQFNNKSNAVRVLSLDDNRYFEISLTKSDNNESRTRAWSDIGLSSVHLNSWENLLYPQIVQNTNTITILE